jgi:hypothetical protein
MLAYLWKTVCLPQFLCSVINKCYFNCYHTVFVSVWNNKEDEDYYYMCLSILATLVVFPVDITHHKCISIWYNLHKFVFLMHCFNILLAIQYQANKCQIRDTLSISLFDPHILWFALISFALLVLQLYYENRTCTCIFLYVCFILMVYFYSSCIAVIFKTTFCMTLYFCCLF